MLRPPILKLAVTIVGNPSFVMDEAVVEISNKWSPNVNEIFTDVKNLCNGLPHRIYWRLSSNEFLILKNYVNLKCAIILMLLPRIYVVLDELQLFVRGDEIFYRKGVATGKKNNNSENDYCDDIYDSVIDKSFLKGNDNSKEKFILSDVDILRCVTSTESNFDNSETSNYFYDRNTEMIYTREYEDRKKKMTILAKGFPQVKRKYEPELFLEPRDEIKKIEGKVTKPKKT